MKGFGKKKDIDFEENFLPVDKMSLIQDILSLVANMNLEIELLNVKTTFFYNDLEEKNYMKVQDP